MKPLTHASLFSGIGGFDLAAEWAGWTNLFNCEKDAFCQTVLKYHFPNATQYSDIRDTDFTIWRGRIDVLTGGFPCQPFSNAGKRKGTDDDRYLWPEMLRAIREIRPRWIVGENVRGIVNWSEGLVFEQVCADLDDEGYQVTPYILPACGVGAPHRRDRVWFVAHAEGDRDCGRSGKICKTHGRQIGQVFSESINTSDLRTTTDCADAGIETVREWPDGILSEFITTNAECRRGNEVDDQVQSQQPDGTRVDGLGCERTTADTNSIMQQCGDGSRENGWNQSQVTTEPLESTRGWHDVPTQSPVCGGNDGLSAGLDGITFPKWRSESIKAYGNAIVPQVAYQIFKAINEYERTTV